MSNDLDEDDLQERSLPSFSFVPTLLMLVGIFFMGSLLGKSGAIALVGLCFSGVLFEMFSPYQYAKMRQTYPQMDKQFWLINCFMFHLLLPVLMVAALYFALSFVVRLSG